MPRTVINRSISFDPQLFESMEARRSKLMMQRSEYVTRCILRDMIQGGAMTVTEVPNSIVQNPIVSNAHPKRGASPGKKDRSKK